MKRRYFFLLLLLLIIAALLIWFFCRGRNDVAGIIPEDARAVAALDVKELSQTTGLEVDKLCSKLGVAEVGQSGLDFSAPVYGFVSRQGHFGIALSVKSKRRVKKALQQIGTDVESQRGLQWAMVKSWIVAFDSDRMLVMGPASSSEVGSLRGQMTALMNQKKVSSPTLNDLNKRSGTLKLISRMDVMPKAYVQMLKKWLPAGIDFNSVSAFAALDAQKTSFTLHTELLSEDKQVLNSFAQIDSLLRPIQGSLLDQGHSSPVLWVTAGLKGDRLLTLLRQNPTIRTHLIALNMCVDADMMLRSIDGDVSLSVPSISLGFKLPTALLTAKLSNKDFLHNVDSWKTGLATDAGVRFRVLRDNDFHLSAGNVNAFFGVRGDQLYITSDARLAEQACRPVSTPSLQGLLPQMKNQVFFATFDASAFMKSLGLLAQLLSSDSSILKAVNAIERINLSASNSHDITLEVQCNRDLADFITP